MDTEASLKAKVVAKAEEETDFRGLLIDDPRSALKEAFDIEFPDDFKVLVHADDARTTHLVLPSSPELTDIQLQRAAGGGINHCSEGPFDTEWEIG